MKSERCKDGTQEVMTGKENNAKTGKALANSENRGFLKRMKENESKYKETERIKDTKYCHHVQYFPLRNIGVGVRYGPFSNGYYFSFEKGPFLLFIASYGDECTKEQPIGAGNGSLSLFDVSNRH